MKVYSVAVLIDFDNKRDAQSVAKNAREIDAETLIKALTIEAPSADLAVAAAQEWAAKNTKGVFLGGHATPVPGHFLSEHLNKPRTTEGTDFSNYFDGSLGSLTNGAISAMILARELNDGTPDGAKAASVMLAAAAWATQNPERVVYTR